MYVNYWLLIIILISSGCTNKEVASFLTNFLCTCMFYIVRCQSDIDVFSDAGMVDSTPVFIQSAVKFLATTAQLGSKLGPALAASLQRAFQLTTTHAIYAFVYFEILSEHLEELKNVLKSSPIPVHFICFINNSSQKNNIINCLKELCATTHGR